MITKWDIRFLKLAEHISKWSKDPSTCVGAVIVNPNTRNILSVGYNGFPKGVVDDERLNDKETKYPLIVHAEMNAIYNATSNGTPLQGSTLYVHGLPICADCAKGIIQVGIKRVVIPLRGSIPEKWRESWYESRELFDETHVEIEFIENENYHSIT